MAQTYFNHEEEERFTWISANKTTKKVLDYILVEPFIQQYINDCAVFLDFECDSDHRIIISEMLTPTTKKARWKQQEKSTVPKPDPKALNEKETKKVFLQAVANEMKNNNQPTETEDTNLNIKGCLDSAADSTLPKIKGK